MFPTRGGLLGLYASMLLAIPGQAAGQAPGQAADGASGAAGSGEALDFSLARLGGGEQSLGELRGQWVALNYWATWCGPCRKEIPDLSELHDRNPSVTVLGLAYEETSEEEFLAFLEDYPASYPILLVDVMSPPEPFGAPRVLPTTILIDPQGRETKTWVGPVTSEQIEAAIAVAAGTE